ncbi:MAG: hypothetical protein H7328_08020 [Bdellovibrio sp.]|nr:hypothetical protein [Bdellovibrio sp.]
MTQFFLIALLVATFSINSPAQVAAKEFQAAQISLDYLSSDGSYWYDCTHEKSKQPHDWVVSCNGYTFNLHVFLYEYLRPNETTFEFHFWADEIKTLKETHTQSTWLTVDQSAHTKKIVGYLGFKNDSSQLRIELNLK